MWWFRRCSDFIFRGERPMPKFVIERNIPGAGSFTAEQLKGISQTSCSVLNRMGPQVQWVQSYVTDDKVYCIYIAPDEETVREHARQGQFPANSVQAVRTVIDPTTAEA
jgi:hypothetical protein